MERFRTGLVLFCGLSLSAITASANEAPYSGWEGRQIKALSAEQIEDLRAGRGMGMALPAELNGYPGPRHVLDLADQLGLTAEQHGEAQRLFEAMQAQAMVLGQEVIESEVALDQMFASQTASDESVLMAAVEAGQRRGALRGHHLRYHLAMRDLLSRHQIMRYRQLRGYDGAGSHGDGAAHNHGEGQ